MKNRKLRRDGARVCVYAVQPLGGTSYVTAYLQIVSYPEKSPKTAKEAMEMWWEHKSMSDATRTSSVHRKLKAGRTHAEKVIEDINRRCKANVVLMPEDISKELPQMQVFLDDLMWCKESADWKFHQRWLLSGATQLEGGVFSIEPVSKRKAVVNTGNYAVDFAWGMIQAWLDENLPITPLRNWMTRAEYLDMHERLRA